MKKLLIVTLCVSSTAAMAQKRVDTLVYPKEKIVVETDSSTVQTSMGGAYAFNEFWSNWYISAGGGANVFWGNEQGLKPFGKRITPTLEFAFGKWIYPAIGFRGRFGGGLVKSYSTGTLPSQGHSLIVGGPDADGVYSMRWHHVYGEVDIMVDLFNAIWGYNRVRFYSAIPYLGAGVSIVQHQPSHDGDRTTMGIGGLYNKFRITDHFDLSLDLRHAIVKQTVDRQISGLDFEAYSMVTAAITYHFGKAGQKIFGMPASTSTIVSKTYRPLPQLPVKDTTTIRQETIREVIVEKRHSLTQPMAVFFNVNSAEITDRTKINLAFAADIIKTSGGAKFRLIGSADSKTASTEYNNRLSAKRSKAVMDYLVQILLVDPNQLVLDPVGGIDIFKPKEVNRAVIIRQEQDKP